LGVLRLLAALGVLLGLLRVLRLLRVLLVLTVLRSLLLRLLTLGTAAQRILARVEVLDLRLLVAVAGRLQLGLPRVRAVGLRRAVGALRYGRHDRGRVGVPALALPLSVPLAG
jgi:hypothetical protein